MSELSGFDVTRSNNYFKLCVSPVAIRLNEFTKMVEVSAVTHLISTEMFRFRSVEQLMSLANTNVELPGNIVDRQGGGHTPDDDMHGKRSASSKFNVGVSSGGNPAEGGEDPKEPSDAEETIASREQTKYNSETVYNVSPDSPEGESTEKGSECKVL
ncbi:hypothetical protein HID58_066948 [Brassica napus]|uniref:Uncharacterized protein n=1 Tax=Brassica napus TaxID=3708 RepID=A0ABQ7ZH43_BRANA|nr:hypothetical protein HID58_066948 [Brassica napus]